MHVHARRLLISILEAAGVSALAVGTVPGCGPRVGTDDMADADSGEGETDTDPTATTGQTSVATTGATTSQTTTATTGPTTITTGQTSTDPDSDTWDCPIDVYDVYECYDPPGETDGDTTAGDSSGGDATTGDGTTTGGSDGATEGGGLCAAYEVEPPPFDSDCGLYAIDWSGPYEDGGQCCFEVTYESGCCGRPFTVEHEARTADVAARTDWADRRVPSVAGLDAAEREALARAWADDGLAEHASVASFSRFVLQLLAVGAPPALVADAQQAIADEIEHARLCFALASRYADGPIGPGPLPLQGALDEGSDLASILCAVIREGCVGETLAALQALAAADQARDAAVREALQTIAEDELRHAALGWRFVRWALATGGPHLRAVAQRTFAALIENPPAAPALPGWTKRLAAHGRLCPQTLQRLYEDGMWLVVRPAAAALHEDLAAGREPAVALSAHA